MHRQADVILANSIEFFTLCDIKFELPIVWLDAELEGNMIAEWGNYFIEDFGMYHGIKVDFTKIKSDLDFYETFLHELVHALQYEKKLDVDHNEFFMEWVKYFADLGWNISSEDCKLEFTGQFNDLLCNPERYK